MNNNFYTITLPKSTGYSLTLGAKTKKELVDEIIKNTTLKVVNARKLVKDYSKKNQSSIKKQSKMSTKKPTAKQLEARKRFAEMAKNGTLAKKRKSATKTKKTGLKKPVTKGLTTLCAKTVGVDGRRKKDGTVKKNHVVKKGGKVVAVKKKTAIKK